MDRVQKFSAKVKQWLKYFFMLDEESKKEYRELLAPRILKPGDEHYSAVEELRFALSKSECKNIAITGVFGSGKSSVINTYISQLPKHKQRGILRLSLSNFCDEKNDQRVKNNNSDIEKEEYENRVEFKIFQHIFYKANQRKTRQTHYSRISHLSILHAVGIAFGIIALIVAIGVLCWPNCNQILTYNVWYANELKCLLCPNRNVWIFWTAIAYLFIALVYVIAYLLRRFHHTDISKIKTNHVELQLVDKDESFFNSKLNELLYFIKAGGYNLVVFEDLDRINNPHSLFLKLREINILLNESDYYIRHNLGVRFVYAILDDVFTGEIRTKCFDYILPIIPVVDSYNSGDYLITKYSNLFPNIKKQDLLVLGMYINGKRAISNIINEFLSYKSANVLKGKMSETKLLAMIIYKNLFPWDYAAAYTNQGCLYKIFSNKKPFYQHIIDEKENRLSTIDKDIAALDEQIINIYQKTLDWLGETQDAKALVYNGNQYLLSKINEDQKILELFGQDKIKEFVAIDEDGNEMVKKMHSVKSIISEIDNEEVNSELLHNKEQRVMELRGAREEIIPQIEMIKREPISQLILTSDAATVKATILQICKEEIAGKEHGEMMEQVNVIHTFLRRSYISEDYAMYMSYNYEGALTKNDFDFVNSVFQTIPLSYDWELTNCGSIMEKLRTEDYRTEACLNNSLVDYLLKTPKEKSNFANLVITARKKIDFIVQYCQTRNDVLFAEKVFNNWNNCVECIYGIQDKGLKQSMKLLFYKVTPKTIILSPEERDMIALDYEFIRSIMEMGDTSKLSNFIRVHDIHFDRIVAPKENDAELYKYIVENHYFKITAENQQVIYGEKWNSQPMTQILNGDNKVKVYLLEDMQIIMNTFTETATKEDSKALVFLANNENVESSMLKDYLLKQENKMDAASITKPKSAQIAFETNTIAATWKNVAEYFRLNENQEPILSFIKMNMSELTKQKCVEQNIHLMNLLFADNETLNIEEYGRLAPCFASIVMDDVLSTLVDLDEDRVFILVKNKMIAYDEDNINFVKAYGAPVFAQYLVSVFEDFKEDDKFDESLLTNEVGIAFLNSNATLEQKAYMLVNYLSVDAMGVNTSEYAKLFCFYINKLNDFKGLDATKIVSAMDLYQEGGAEWRVKMSLINKLNLSKSFNANFETQMLKTLHMESYDKLTYNGSQIVKLDDNPENNQLLDFLKAQNYYISNVGEPILGKRKVSMIHNPLK